MITKIKRKIVEIDEEKCNGCGQCATACAEGAIRIVDGKAKLVSETYCDGLGACLGDCPEDAIRIVEREADVFDEVAVEKHLKNIGKKAPAPAAKPAHAHPGGGCPGSRMLQFDDAPAEAKACDAAPQKSELRQWPVQLTLVSPAAPYFKDADLLLVADCVPFAVPDFHQRFLKGRAVVVGCPKLDDAQFYVEKLTQVLLQSDVKSIRVARMEVPCCGGLSHIAREAVNASGKNIPITEEIVGIR